MPRETYGAVRLGLPALLQRMLRYGGVGFAISLIYSVVMIAAVHVLQPIGPVAASILALGIVLPIAWNRLVIPAMNSLAQMFWVFRSRPNGRQMA